MRKARIAALFASFLMFLAACGAGDVDIEYTENKVDNYYVYNGIDVEPVLEHTPEYVYFLKDLDYMLYVLENNFALFDVAYWGRGVDIYAIIDSVRADILANPNMNADDFLTSMAYNFSDLRGIAHFSIELPNAHTVIIGERTPMMNMMFTENTLARWRYPHVIDFYRRQLSLGLWTEARRPMIQGDAERQRILDRFILFGKQDEVDEINHMFAQGDYNGAVFRIINTERTIGGRPNVVAESLEENRVAYLSIDSFRFMNDPSSDEWYADKEEVHSFFEEIRGYEHLIIDLRRNLGGMPRFFEDVIVRSIIDEAVEVRGFAFAQSGYYARERLDEASEGANFMVLNELASFIGPTDNRLRLISEMLEEFDLPELNMSDMERMNYGFPIHMERLYPKRLERFGYERAFEGKVWVLTSHLTGSAAQVNAWLSKESGFATHVGETSGGNFGGPRTAVALPNSGMLFRMDVFYVTDERGRPLEAGTVPHHFNLPGMDALETVLVLIAEGNY